MRSRAHLLTALILLVVGADVSAQTADVAIDPLRQYGYVIGDRVELHVRAQVPPGYELDLGRLPKPGRVSTFLELQGMELDRQPWRSAFGAQRAAELAVRFLVVNSGIDVRTIQTPVLPLSYRRAGAPDLTVEVPQVELTVSPLTPEYVSGTAGLEPMRPDIQPPQISTGAPRARLLLYALIALGLLGYAAWRLGWVPRRLLGRRPFARAAADIRRIGPAGGVEREAACARRLHRAFDEAAGFAVASHSLERFFAVQPWSAALDGEIRDFFAASARYFYAGDASGMLSSERLKRLARRLVEHEPRRVGT
jgi:mxaA protein